MSDDDGGDDGDSITSLTTPYRDPNLLSAFEAMWTSPPIAIPLKGLALRRLFERPAKHPDERAKAAYFAAWYGQEDLPFRDSLRPLLLVGMDALKNPAYRPSLDDAPLAIALGAANEARVAR